MSLISEAARIEIEVLALHGEAALAGISRRGEKDDVTVGEIAATGERLDDAALAGERRVRGGLRISQRSKHVSGQTRAKFTTKTVGSYQADT